MSKQIRVVLAGCGGMSQAWLKAAQERSDTSIVGLVDLQESAAKHRKEQFGLASAATGTDLGEMLQDLQPDVVFDVTIPEGHEQVTLDALAHGCHVMGEKPLAHNMEAARKMVKAAEDAGKIFAVMQNRRYDPRIRALRAFLDSGKIGRLTTLNSDFYLGAHFGGFRDRMEHVLLLDMAIHSFDQARLISGADPVAVYCVEWNPAGSWYDHDASAVAIFEMSGGVIYTYRGSWCAEGLNTSWECDWRAVGESGSAEWDGADNLRAQGVVKAGGFHSEMKDLQVGPLSTCVKTGHDGAINEFLDCVRDGGVPETTATDNIKSLTMVFAAIESAKTKRRIPIKC